MVDKCIAVMAVDSKYGVGKNNDLPWPKNKEDMKCFKETTQGKVVIMGRKTWESIGSKKLPNRINVVLSTQPVSGPDITMNGDIKSVYDMLLQMFPEKSGEDFCIIGGASIIKDAHEAGMLGKIYLTYIEGIYACDTFFDKEILKHYNLKWVNLLKEDNPRTVLKVYEKGIGDNARIQKINQAYN